MLSAIAILLIIFSALPAVLLSIPSVQNAAIDRAALFASDYLGSTVRVGKITLGGFSRITVRDFYVEDLDGDTLLFVNRADATIGPLSLLFNRNLKLTEGVVTGGKFVLCDTKRGEVNVKEITDKISSRERKSDFKFSMDDVCGSDISFRMHLDHDKDYGDGIDFANMCIDDIAVVLDDFEVVNGVVSSQITALSFKERTGFEVEDFSGRFCVDSGKLSFDDIKIRTARSQININSVLLNGKDWLEYKDFINNVPITMSAISPMLSGDGILPFTT